jgi:hypothetical protein
LIKSIHPQIDVLQADFSGKGKYGVNLVAAKPDLVCCAEEVTKCDEEVTNCDEEVTV